MITLKAYSPWNGHENYLDAAHHGSLYTIAEGFDVDPSSYTTISDMMVAVENAADMFGVDKPRFVLSRYRYDVEVGDNFDAAFQEILI